MNRSARCVRQYNGDPVFAGQVCKVRSEDRERFNSTSQFGQCSETCQCLPLAEHELPQRHRELFFYQFVSPSVQVLDVKNITDLKKLPFEMKLSPNEFRFQDRCERFENSYEYETSDPGNFQDECKVSCRVLGSIGKALDFLGIDTTNFT